MFPTLMFGRPLILTAGMRNSSASNFGFTGFADHCATTVEADAVTLVTDWFAFGYEFRQRSNPYDVIRAGNEELLATKATSRHPHRLHPSATA